MKHILLTLSVILNLNALQAQFHEGTPSSETLEKGTESRMPVERQIPKMDVNEALSALSSATIPVYTGAIVREANRVVYIQSVDIDSPTYLQGVQPGYQLTHIDGMPIRRATDYRRALSLAKSGEYSLWELKKGTDIQKIKITCQDISHASPHHEKVMHVPQLDVNLLYDAGLQRYSVVDVFSEKIALHPDDIILSINNEIPDNALYLLKRCEISLPMVLEVDRWGDILTVDLRP